VKIKPFLTHTFDVSGKTRTPFSYQYEMLILSRRIKISQSNMNRIPEVASKNRTFCLEDEGILAAVQIMADHHLRQVLVINSAGEIVGKYTLNNSRITFSNASEPNPPGASS
jgi:hypothetical protein